MDNRLKTLDTRIKYWMDPKNKITKISEELYYDGYRPHDAPEAEAIVIDDSESESEDEEESEESKSEDEDDSDDEDEDYNPKYDKRAYKRRKID
jgi:U3 small nucleolar RNA-associated protein 14